MLIKTFIFLFTISLATNTIAQSFNSNTKLTLSRDGDFGRLNLSFEGWIPGLYDQFRRDALSIVRDAPTCSSGWKERVIHADLVAEAKFRDVQMLNTPGYALLGEHRDSPGRFHFKYTMTRNRCYVDDRNRCRAEVAGRCVASVRQYRLRTRTDLVRERRYTVDVKPTDDIGIVNVALSKPQFPTYNSRQGKPVASDEELDILERMGFHLSSTSVGIVGKDPKFIWKHTSEPMPFAVAKFILDSCLNQNPISCLKGALGK